MSTIIAIAVLGIICLIAEIFNLRKAIVPVTVIGLLAILGITVAEFNVTESYYNNMIVVNRFTVTFSSLFILLTVFLVTLSHNFYKDRPSKLSDFVAIKIFLLLGAVAMVSFGNLAMFFLGIEILSISLYILAGSNPVSLKSNEAGMKYFLMGSFASGIILFGIALIYGAVASFDMNMIYEASNSATTVDWFYIGVCMITVGMLFKIATVPFHFWAPDVYEGAPSLTTATMSTLAKVVAMATFFKLNLAMNGNMNFAYETVIVIISIASMTVGNIMALRQNNIKRMLAFSGISHAGFMLMALLNLTSATGSLFYYTVAYTLAGIAAFAVILYVCNGKDNENIDNFNGLGKTKPLMAMILSASLLSMAGIPIFSGFFAKFFILNQTLQAGYLILVIAGIINSIISVYYYFRVISAMYTKEASEEAKPVPFEFYIVAVVAIGLNIAIGLFPSALMDLL
ncbi:MULTISPECIES: NADH-quinone oxidoreductase subunit N [Flavobacterium]|uniref:NADH-quinone oxidoreductase subunit N n=1 Tax=Flavobacterium TaxID=237 RepID=UPI00086AC016|nr:MULTISPECIES: NADH-quinone oxidoreductase subunit N [Flavobacterium]MBN9283506.1 NADH-quinone oxidoreductase subunit N [Flavobacterium sp.]ODS85129.1 MAG: NADH-quinone oxidoreductase subunit N [Chryseobacterium sp. SCN 40-13]OJV69374.1 MAG: NADH-quinone oxidoreductase subunit N [Flavobacterium sp. 40-81]HRB72825.1 NADH-quinone oxidoreductase subunit N [Flavobacterium sp.]